MSLKEKIKNYGFKAFMLLGVVYMAGYGYGLFDFCDQRSQKQVNSPVTHKVKEKHGKKYAILFNAGEEKDQFYKGLEFAFESLKRAGFSDENIYTLTGYEYEKPAKFIDFRASKKKLEEVVSELKEKTTKNDILFLFVTHHGEKTAKILPLGESHFTTKERFTGLFNEKVSQSEFKKMMEGLNVNYAVLLFSQCYSGGFAEELGYNNFIAASSSRSTKPAYGVLFGGYKNKMAPFVEGFFSALGGINIKGVKSTLIKMEINKYPSKKYLIMLSKLKPTQNQDGMVAINKHLN